MRLPRTQEVGSIFFFLAPALSVTLCFIFFILIGGKFLLQPGIAVKVPQAPFLLVPQHDSCVVSITGSPLSAVYFDNQEVSLEELKRSLLARAVSGTLIVKADQQTPYDLLVQVMTVGINCGFSVVLATNDLSAPSL
jgi:biopolymer transport protein ExbD